MADLTQECVELVLVLAIHAARRDISDGTALTGKMPECQHLSLQSREAPGPYLAEAGDRVRLPVQHRRKGDRGPRDPSSWFSPVYLH